MKNSFLKKALIGFIGLVAFMGCENENLPQENLDSTTEKNFQVFSYTPEQANELNERIFASSGKTLQSLTNKNGKGNLNIDRQNVYTVQDSVGNLTHAYRVFLEEQKPYTILNLVVAERSDGSQAHSFVIEYKWEPEYFEDKLDGHLEREYERTVSYYPLSSFLLNKNGKSTFTSKSSDPCNQDTQNVNPSSGSGGSYNPNYFNFFSSGSSSVGPAGPMSGLNNYGGGSTSVGTVEVGQGCFCENIGYESKGSPTSKNDDCPDVRAVVPVNEMEEEYPDCNSFKFKKVASTWQAACVKDFEMGVGVYTMSNFQMYRIKIPQLTFETWTKDRFNNVTSPGAAAELAAQAIDNTARAAVKHFQDKSNFTEYEVTKWFENSLKNEFRNMTDGGGVQRGNPYNLTPSNFESGKNDCD